MSFLQKKIVIRKLPPTFNSETLLEQISPVPEFNYYYFVAGDSSECPFSRAYFNFVKNEELSIFREKFHGYVFLDEKGNEYPASVELAPFPKVPKLKVKVDPKAGTIESDHDYLKFLEVREKLKLGQTVTPEAILEDAEAREKLQKGCLETSTPLAEHLAKKKEEKRLAQLLKAKQREEERKKRLASKEYNKKSRENHYEDIKISSKHEDESQECDKDSVGPKHSIKPAKGVIIKSKPSEGFKSKDESYKPRSVFESSKRGRDNEPYKKGKGRYGYPREKPEDEKHEHQQKEQTSHDKHSYKEKRSRHEGRTQSTSESENKSHKVPFKTSSTQQNDNKHEVRIEESTTDRPSEKSKDKKDDGVPDRSATSKQRMRYKDRPERAIYRPGQRKDKTSDSANP